MGMMVVGLLSTSLLSVDALEDKNWFRYIVMMKLRKAIMIIIRTKPLYYYEGSMNKL